MKKGAWGLLLASLASAALQPAQAEPQALTGEIQYSPAGQMATTAEVARMPGGGFIAAWYACAPDCHYDVDVSAQVFDANAVPVTPVIAVNQTRGAIQILSSVATDAQGNFVVVWRHNNGEPNYDDHRIYGRRFAASGEALGDEFRVDTSGGPHLDDPVVAMAPDGRFVVVWYSVSKVEARLYGSDGQPAGTPFTIEVWGDYNPDVAMRADGSFIVTYTHYSQVFASGWNADGSNQFPRVHVSSDADTPETWWHGLPSVGVQADGGFQVAWSRISDDHGADAVLLRRFDAAGVPRGGSVQVNEAPASGFWPSIGVDALGTATVAWTDRDSAAIVGRTFDPLGVPDGGPYRVSEGAAPAYYFTGVTTRSVLFGDDGRFMISWWRHTSDSALYARFYGAAVTDPGEDPPPDDDGDGCDHDGESDEDHDNGCGNDPGEGDGTGNARSAGGAAVAGALDLSLILGAAGLALVRRRRRGSR